MLRIFQFLLLGMMGGCAPRVVTIYDHHVDFRKFKTFCWMDGCEFKVSGPLYFKDSILRLNLENAMMKELQRKGLRKDTVNPDLLVGLTIITLKHDKLVMDYYSQYKRLYRPYDLDKYLRGTMIIAMADKTESKMVWESYALRSLEVSPDIPEKKVHKGIKYALQRFPPKK